MRDVYLYELELGEGEPPAYKRFCVRYGGLERVDKYESATISVRAGGGFNTNALFPAEDQFKNTEGIVRP